MIFLLIKEISPTIKAAQDSFVSDKGGDGDGSDEREMSHSQIIAKYQNDVTSFGPNDGLMRNGVDRMDEVEDDEVTESESKESLFANTNFSESQRKPNSLLNESNTEDERKYFKNLSDKWERNKNGNKNHNKYAVFEYPDD